MSENTPADSGIRSTDHATDCGAWFTDSGAWSLDHITDSGTQSTDHVTDSGAWFTDHTTDSGAWLTDHTTDSGAWFTDHTIESAPPGSRRLMTATRNHLGYLPAATARWATSPHLLDGFGKLTAIFENCTLDPVAREVVIMTIATRNGCGICVAMHTARVTALGADAELIVALRDAGPLDDERLEAIRVFTLRVLDTAGDIGAEAIRAFLASGYTPQNALEVVLGIGTYTMSTLANRLTGASVDDQLSAFAWYPQVG